MQELVVLCVLSLFVGVLGTLWRGWRLRSVARERLADWTDEPLPEMPVTRSIPPLIGRYQMAAWLVAVAAGFGLYFGLRVGPWFAPALALVLGLLLSRLEAFWYELRVARLEQQLGAALDLLTSALQAGSSLLAALESTIRELKQPLREVLEELSLRIRLGDRPQTSLEILVQRAPLENMRLFATTLAVHWEVGGSLGPTLAAVSRTVRDRVELSRRMQAMTMQARVTTLVVLGSVYFIGLLMWRNDPGRMEAFVTTTIGQASVAVAIVLQALGIVWIGAIAKPRF